MKKAKQYSVSEILQDPANMHVWVYAKTLTSLLEDQGYDVVCEPRVIESGEFVNTVFEGTRYYKNYDVHLSMHINAKEFQIILNSLAEDAVDLFLIKVTDKGQGLGSELMDLMRLIADDTYTNISLVPVAINTTDDPFEAEVLTKNLRDWYSFMRFIDYGNSPEMVYYGGWAERAITADQFVQYHKFETTKLSKCY